jgi:transcriptional regulator with XRE-family HTH domain
LPSLIVLAIKSIMHVKHRLVEWRRKEGLSQREAARRARISQAAWQSYEDDTSTACPGVNAALAIEEITGGAVRVAEWRELDVSKAVRKARAASKRVPRTRAAAGH